MEDIDAMFSDLLGEIDLVMQSFEVETVPSETSSSSRKEGNFAIGFTNLNESLNELDDSDLYVLMADLVCPGETLVERVHSLPVQQKDKTLTLTAASITTPRTPFPAPPTAQHAPEPTKPPKEAETQTKADKIKLALKKLKEAKVKKLVVKVLMNDGSSKTLLVDERQTVRELLDNLFEKTHCDCSVDWSLCETNPELQTERGFEDHEHIVEHLSTWTRDTENRLLFLRRPEKNAIFEDPQIFYLRKKKEELLKDTKGKDKERLLKESFDGPSVIVPDLEGALYLKENGKKLWKRRYFLLRASGIYYVPKGKTKTSTDLACFIQFDNVNVYYTTEYKHKHKAPTDFCFMLKHPRIQKESEYVRFLCCDDEHTQSLWVTAIRVAKYGVALYRNYQAAVKRASEYSLRTSCSVSYLTMLATGPKATAVKTSPIPPALSQTQRTGHPHLQEDYFPEPPPDFLPPPPPGWTARSGY